MVIEHSFVTTLDAPQAMQAASEMLGRRGFTSEGGSGFMVGQTQWDRLDLRRGKKASREISFRIAATSARGLGPRRVTVALAIEPSATWGGSAWNMQLGFGVNTAATDGNAKKMRLHTELLMSIVRSLEELLANRQPPEYAMRDWDRAEAEIAAAARKRRIRNYIIVAVVVAFFAAMIALVTIAANSR